MGYIKNLKDSFTYAIDETLDEYVPHPKRAVSGLLSAVQSLRAQTSAQGGVRSVMNNIKRLPFFGELSMFSHNVYRGITTGKVYGDVGMDFDDLDLGDYGSLIVDENYDGDEWGIDDSHKNSNGEDLVSRDAKFGAKVMYDTSKANSDVIMNTLIKNHIDSKLMITQFSSNVDRGFGNTNDSLNSIIAFNNDVMRQWADQSIKYYGDSMGVLNDIKKSLHVATDPEQSGRGGGTWEDRLNNGDYAGGLKDALMKIANHQSGGTAGMLFSVLPIFAALYAANPGMIPLDMIKSKLNNKFGIDGLKDIKDKIDDMGTMVHDLAANASFSDNKWVAGIGKGLMIKTSEKKDIKPEFKKEKVAWDTTSKTTLEIVIPGLLNKIASSLTGMPTDIYDMMEQQWKTQDQIVREFHASRPKSDDVAYRTKSVLGRYVDKTGADKNKIHVQNQEVFDALMEAMSKGLLDRGLSIDQVTKSNMKFEGKDGMPGFKDLFDFKDPKMQALITDDLFRQVRGALLQSYKEEDNDQYKNMHRSYRDYMKNNNRFWKDAQKNSTEKGYVHTANGLKDIIPEYQSGAKSGGKKGKIKKGSGIYDKEFQDDNVNTEEKMLELMARKRRFAHSDAELENSMNPVNRRYTDEELGKMNDNSVGVLDIMHTMLSREFEHNPFLQNFKDSEFSKKIRSGEMLDVNNVLSGKVSNPFRKFLEGFKKDIKEDLANKSGRELTGDEDKRIDDIADNTMSSLDDEISSIDKSDLSDKEKKKKKESLFRARLSGAMTAIKKMFGNTIQFSGENKENAKSAGKMILAGVGGILGVGLLGKIMKKLPVVGAVMGTFGILTPLFLTGLGVASGVYAYKSGLLDGLIGDFKDPTKRKEMMGKFFKNTLPSIMGGAVLGTAANAVFGSIPMFGPVLGPIMGATIGLGTAIYAHKNKIFANLFGKDSTDKEKSKSVINMFTAGATSAVGLAGAAGLLKLAGGLPVVGGLVAGAGGLIGAPIMLAAGAVAGGILLEKEDIKKRIFGDGAEKHSFVKNMGNWLFGDKETNKEGLLTRQFRKMSKGLDVAGSKITDWYKTHIVENIKIGFKPFTEAMGNIGKGIIGGIMGGWDKMSGKMQDAMDKGFFKSLSVLFEEKVINPIGAKLSSFFGWMFKIIGGIVSMPFKGFAKIFGGRTAKPGEGTETPAGDGNSFDSAPSGESDNRRNLLDRIGYGHLDEAQNRHSIVERKKEKIKAEKEEARKREEGAINFWSNVNLDETVSRDTFGKGGRKRGFKALSYSQKMLGNLFGKGGETFYNQNDSSWGSMPLGDSTMKDSGCGIAAMAMLVSHIRNRKVTPKDLLPLAQKHKIKGDGVATGFFTDVANAYYLTTSTYQAHTVDPRSILDIIDKDTRIIALMSEAYNRTSKHYVYIYGVKDKKILFSDPTGKDKEEMDYLVFHSYARQYLVFADKDIHGEKMRVDNKPTIIQRIRNKFPGGSHNDIMDEEKRIHEAGNRSISNEELEREAIQEGRNSDKDDKGIGVQKGSSLLHLRSVDKYVRKIYQATKDRKDDSSLLKMINRTIRSQTTGVAYNLEYIKRLMIKHMGDLGNGEKPESNPKDGNFKVRKYHPILNWFSGLFGWGKDKMWGGVTGIFDFGKLMVDRVTDLLFNNRFVTFFTDKVSSVFKFFTETIPNAIIKPFELAGKFLGEAITGIVTGLNDIKDAAFGLVGDIWKGVKTVFGDIYSIVSSAVKHGISFAGVMITGLAKSGWDFFSNSKFGSKVINGIGDFLQGALGAGGGVLGSIGSFLKATKEAAFGTQKVFVAGGKLEMIDRIGTITAVGTIDADAARKIDEVNKPQDTAAEKEKAASSGDKKANEDMVSDNVNRVGDKGDVDKNQEMKEEDKEQDEKDKQEKKLFSGWMDMFRGKKGEPGKGWLSDKGIVTKDETGKYGGYLGWLAASMMGGKRILGGLAKGALGIGKLGAGMLGLGALGHVAGRGMQAVRDIPLLGETFIGQASGAMGDWTTNKTTDISESVVNNDIVTNAFGTTPLDRAASIDHALRASRFVLNNRFGLNKAMAAGLVESSAKRIGNNLSKYVSKKEYTKILKSYGVNSIGAASKQGTRAAMNKGVLAKATNWLFRNPKVEAVLMKHGINVSQRALKELIEVAAKNGAKKSTIIALRTGANFIPYAGLIVAASFFTYDLISGMWTAAKLFKVNKADVTWKMRIVAGMIKAIQGLVASTGVLFILGLIPVEYLIDWTKKFFFSDQEISDIEDSRYKRAEKDQKEAMNNIKDPVARREAEKKNAEANKEKFDNMVLPSTSGGRNYWTKDDISKEDADLAYGGTLEKIIEKKGMAVSDADTVRRSFSDNIKSNDQDKKENRTWTGNYDKDALNKKYDAMKNIWKDPNMYQLSSREAAFNYTFANGYTFAEVGCIPASLAYVYESLGVKPNRQDMAMVADYYANYINGGKGVPMAMAVDYAVMDGFKVKNLKAVGDIDSELSKGRRIIALTKYNGSNHAVAITGRDTDGRYIINDPLNGREQVVDRNNPIFKSITSGMVLGYGDGREDFDYYLYDNSSSELQKPNFKWDNVGNFANPDAITESKAWAKIKWLNGDAKSKPKDFKIIDDTAEMFAKEMGVASINKAGVKQKVIRDLYNDSDNVFGGSYSYGTVKTAKGSKLIGSFRMGADGGIKIDGGKAFFMDDVTGKDIPVEVDKSYYYKRKHVNGIFGGYDKEVPADRRNDMILTRLSKMGVNTTNMYGVTVASKSGGYDIMKLNTAIPQSSFMGETKTRKNSKDKLVLDLTAQGPINLERANLTLNNRLKGSNILKDKLNHMISHSRMYNNNSGGNGVQTIVTQPQVYHNSETREVIKTEGVENILLDMNKNLVSMIEILVKNGSIQIATSGGSNTTVAQTKESADTYMSAMRDILKGNFA